MTILLTGATGFLGSHLLHKLLKLGHKVVILKRSTSDTWRINSVLDQVISYDIDKVELSSVLKNHLTNIVINTVTNYGKKDRKISSIVDTNLIFGLKLLEQSIENNVKVFINTDTLLQRDINSYALSKAQLVDWMKFLSNKNTKMVNIKIEHMYGVFDDENKFIYWLINQLKQNKEEIDLTSGVQRRDFIYIDDVVDAYKTIIENLDSFLNFEEFELGSGKTIEVKYFVSKIFEELNKKQKIATRLNFGKIEYRANENMEMKANISKLQKLGWEPKVSIEDGIKKIINGASK
jgi:nucleoside-diphosphate-sugar epimerase